MALLPKTHFMSVDLEVNQPSNKIIQIGIACGDLTTGEVLALGDFYIDPGELLDPFIVQLTGITQEILKLKAIPLSAAYEAICNMHQLYTCYRNPLTWGGGDMVLLRKELGLDDEKFIFGRRWLDVKSLFQMWCFANDLPLQAGLARAMRRFGLTFQGTKHTAMDDARNTFLFAAELVKCLKKL